MQIIIKWANQVIIWLGTHLQLTPTRIAIVYTWSLPASQDFINVGGYTLYRLFFWMNFSRHTLGSRCSEMQKKHSSYHFTAQPKQTHVPKGFIATCCVYRKDHKRRSSNTLTLIKCCLPHNLKIVHTLAFVFCITQGLTSVPMNCKRKGTQFEFSTGKADSTS